MISLRRYILLAIMGAVCVFVAPAYADSSIKEPQIRAAILFNLLRFSDWPDADETSEPAGFTICTLTSDDMKDAIGALKGKKIHGVSLEVLHLNAETHSYEGCKVVYVSEGFEPENSTMRTIAANNILTVGDTDKSLKNGAHMSIQRRKAKMRFSINSQAMKAINVRASSKILNLAVEPTR